MNADPGLAAAIVKIADEKAAAKRDTDTLAAHTDAVAHVQMNERHVIYAYAAMWVVAALFVLFLWRRQQALTAEIASLRRDLDAAATAGPMTAAKDRA
jgi:preprotein translocase subunit YajC